MKKIISPFFLVFLAGSFNNNLECFFKLWCCPQKKELFKKEMPKKQITPPSFAQNAAFSAATFGVFRETKTNKINLYCQKTYRNHLQEEPDCNFCIPRHSEKKFYNALFGIKAIPLSFAGSYEMSNYFDSGIKNIRNQEYTKAAQNLSLSAGLATATNNVLKGGNSSPISQSIGLFASITAAFERFKKADDAWKKNNKQEALGHALMGTGLAALGVAPLVMNHLVKNAEIEWQKNNQSHSTTSQNSDSDSESAVKSLLITIDVDTKIVSQVNSSSTSSLSQTPNSSNTQSPANSDDEL